MNNTPIGWGRTESSELDREREGMENLDKILEFLSDVNIVAGEAAKLQKKKKDQQKQTYNKTMN